MVACGGFTMHHVFYFFMPCHSIYLVSNICTSHFPPFLDKMCTHVIDFPSLHFHSGGIVLRFHVLYLLGRAYGVGAHFNNLYHGSQGDALYGFSLHTVGALCGTLFCLYLGSHGDALYHGFSLHKVGALGGTLFRTFLHFSPFGDHFPFLKRCPAGGDCLHYFLLHAYLPDKGRALRQADVARGGALATKPHPDARAVHGLPQGPRRQLRAPSHSRGGVRVHGHAVRAQPRGRGNERRMARQGS